MNECVGRRRADYQDTLVNNTSCEAASTNGCPAHDVHNTREATSHKAVDSQYKIRGAKTRTKIEGSADCRAYNLAAFGPMSLVIVADNLLRTGTM